MTTIPMAEPTSAAVVLSARSTTKVGTSGIRLHNVTLREGARVWKMENLSIAKAWNFVAVHPHADHLVIALDAA